jgi:thiol-disulfide isomerase/thioredoxin
MFRSFVALLFAGVLSAQTDPSPAARIADLEKAVEANPNDAAARSRLLSLYTIAGMRDAASVKLPRRQQVLWFIENRPGDPVLRIGPTTLEPAGQAMADAEGYALATAAWKKNFAGEPPAAAVYANAIHFFQTWEPGYARKLCGEGLKNYPKDGDIGSAAGELYALTILGAKSRDRFNRVSAFDETLARSDAAQAARREIETTPNADLLARAGAVLASESMTLRVLGKNQEAAAAVGLALQIAERALKLEPENQRVASQLRNVYQSAATAERDEKTKIAFLEKAAQVPGDDISRFYVLSQLARSLLAAGANGRASEAASNLLADAPKYPNDWNYGNAIHWGNIVLGRVAFRDGKVDEAARRLLAAGATKGSPQLNSFGPDFELARELVNKGQTAPVLEYLELVRKFWKMDRGALDYWASAIRDGGVPTFSRMEASAAGRAGKEATLASLVGKPAPELKLKDLAGKSVSLADYSGKIVLLDFWATWCAPCRTEMPIFEKLHREFAGKDVAIVTVDADEPEATPQQYMKEQKFTFPVLTAEGTNTVERWSVLAFPTTFAIDAEGRVAGFAIGSRSEAELRELIGKARK